MSLSDKETLALLIGLKELSIDRWKSVDDDAESMDCLATVEHLWGEVVAEFDAGHLCETMSYLVELGASFKGKQLASPEVEAATRAVRSYARSVAKALRLEAEALARSAAPRQAAIAYLWWRDAALAAAGLTS